MKLNISILFFITVLMAACRPVDYVKIEGGNFGQEVEFLSALIEKNRALEESGLRLLPEDNGSGVPAYSLVIELFSSWKHEYDYGYIIVSRTFFVPADDPLSARTNASLAACLDGTETLVPINELAPPYVALRVDGITADDADYPLIRFTGVKIRSADDKKTTKQLEEKMSLIAEEVRNAHNILIHDRPQPVWLAAGGDLMLGRGASDILLREGPAGVFGETAQMLYDADVAIVNLEGVISNRGQMVPKSFNFRFSPEVTPALRAAGIDAVLHANNHVFDFGEEAFLDSLSSLENSQIGVLGAGVDDDAASRAFVFTADSELFNFYGIASFPRERNGWDGATAAAGPNRAGMLFAGRRGAEKLKERFSSDTRHPAGALPTMNIVFFHGGTEWSTLPDASTRELYTELIGAGADLVIGSHPHVAQGFEWVNGKPVFWSLGNYVFGGMGNTEGGEEGLFLRLALFRRRLLYMEPFPIILTHNRTDIAPPEKLQTFYKRSKELRERNPMQL